MSKLTLNQLSKICGTYNNKKVEISYKISEEETIVVTFKTSLDFTEMDAIVNKVADFVFTSEGEYIPTYKDVVFFGTIIKQLSNIPLPEKKIKDEKTGNEFKAMDLEKIHDVMVQSKIMDKIHEMYNGENDGEEDLYYLIDKLENMISDTIEYRKQQVLNNKQSKLDELFDSVIMLVNNINKQSESFDLESMKPFADTVMTAYKDGNLDPEVLAKAFIKAKGEDSDDNDIAVDTREFDNVIKLHKDIE